MNSNEILKFLSSLPMIFIFLYFIPFLGICLILLRYFMYNDKKKNLTAISLIIAGILIPIPQLVNTVFDLLGLKADIISTLNDVISSDLYVKLVDYSKFLLCVGIIFMIISYVFNILFNKFKNSVWSYIRNYEKTNAEISRKNDMEIKLKQEKAKNTHVVFCPNCGADNMLVGTVGKCKYCRRSIVYKE